jgi:NADH-quinone oxidoreductase subunit D
MAQKGMIGPFALSVHEDGGLVEKLSIGIGYGHRGIEYCSESLVFNQCVFYSDRVDFLAAPACNAVVVLAMERLGGIEIPERASFIRCLLLELNRLHSHLFHLALIAESAGHTPLFHYAQRERERFNDLFEMYCGSRLGFGSICLGGVVENASDGWLFRVEQSLSALDEFLIEARETLLDNPLFVSRLEGLATLSSELAKKNNISGVNARASGHFVDVRRQSPYAAYGDLQMPPIPKAFRGGDSFARLSYRLYEMTESKELILRALSRLPQGNHRVIVGNSIHLPKGEAVQRVETPRGEMGVFLRSEGGTRPVRLKYFTPSYFVMRLMPELLRGEQVEDILLAVHGFDISVSEVDR